MHQIIRPGTLHLNISPDAFHRWATHYLKCKRDFQSSDKFSPVPYFLLCRTIELEIKARHLQKMRQSKVKREFGHKLAEAYKALDSGQRTLNQSEEQTLQSVSDIYNSKDFEYFNVFDALTGYKRFPKLELLESIAVKLIETYS